MRLTFYGGCHEVGRSCLLLEEHHKHLMLDCGVKLGKVVEHPLISEEELGAIRNIAISHTHLDHVGYLPIAFKKGCDANIYATRPTRDLMALLLADYERIQKKKEFGIKDINRVLSKLKLCEYKERVRTDGFEFSFHNAGHILGSAMTRVYGSKRMLYTSDINFRDGKILDGCEKNLEAEVLVMESTYGGKEDHIPSLKTASSELAQVIKDTLKRKGKVLIPSFAVGRGQEILMVLESFMRSGAIPVVPIYVDGMILKANRIYRQNAIYAREEVKMRILMSEEDPFKSRFFFQPKTKARTEVFAKPCIIVSTSGMLTGGPVLQYFERMSNDRRNSLVLVGYQAEGTVGRELLEGASEVHIKGRKYPVKLDVKQVHFSAHSDHADLVKFAKQTRGLKKLFLVHGDQNKYSELAADLKDYEIVIPKNNESYNL